VGDGDLVGHADDAVKAGDIVVGRIALELVADVALQSEPAVVDLDVHEVGGHLDVPHQALQCGTADLIVIATIAAGQAQLELVVDAIDAIDVLGIPGRGPTLAEALDGASEADGPVVGGYCDLERFRNPRIEVKVRSPHPSAMYL
jgi:hypothetical protein